jgi:DNA polymerase IV (DinB-like DNA polymerase)
VSEKVNGGFDHAEELAREIKEDVLAKERLTCSVGVGPNKLVAKIAAGYKKPDGLTMVKPVEVRDFLFPLPVGKLPGVGRKTEKVMLELGVKTIGDLANYNLGSLVSVFGKALGMYFHNASNGTDESPVQERGRAEQISRITTLKEDTRDFKSILETLDKLSMDVHVTIIEEGLSFRSITITAVMEDFKVYSRSKTLETFTSDIESIKAVSKELLENFLKEQFKLKVRRIGVRVSSLEEATGQKHLTEFLAPEG